MTEIKRRAKRLFAGLLGLLMALSLLSTTAFAEDGEASIQITLPTSEDLASVDKSKIEAHPYLVLDQVNDTEIDPTKKQYEVTDDFAAFFAHTKTADGFTSELADVFETANGNGTVYLYYNGTKLVAQQNEPQDTEYITFTGDNAKPLDVTYPEMDLIHRIGENDLKLLYSWLELYINHATPPIPEANSTSNGNDNSTITISGLKEGYYALLFANTPSAISVTQGVMIATKGTDNVATNVASIALKHQTNPLEKTVRNPDRTDEEFGEATTADIGDDLEYQITTQVPILTNEENLTYFKLVDTMDNQQLTGTLTLTLKQNPTDETGITFTAQIPEGTDGQVYTAYFTNASEKKIAKLTVGAYTDTQQGFTVDFFPMTGEPAALDTSIDEPLTKYQGYHVTLAYSAKVTADAVQINENDVKLYVNNDSDDDCLTDFTEVYTYGIDVQKTFSDGNNSADNYEAVKFSLYTKAEYDKYKANQQSTPLTLYGSAGSYKTAGTAEQAGGTELSLSSTGKLTITGLDVGTYWLVETHTADGYSVSGDIKIVLAANANDKKILDETNTTAQLDGAGKNLAKVQNSTGSISQAKFEVLNQKGFNLPQTGGAGTWMFTIGGILLVAAAGVLFALSRKKDGSK